MSKKDIRKKFKQGEFFKNGTLYSMGSWLKRYFEKRTTKRKYNNYEEE